MERRTQILHIITSLEWSNSAAMLCSLLEHQQKQGGSNWPHEVLCLGESTAMAERLESTGVRVHCLGRRRWWNAPQRAWRFLTLLFQIRPRLVQSWQARTRFKGVLASCLTLSPLVWTIHGASFRDRKLPARLEGFFRACTAIYGLIPRRIVLDSGWALERFVERGYPRRKMRLFRVGTDTERFAPKPEEACKMREQLGIPSNAPVVGLLDSSRGDHILPTILRAAFRLQDRMPNAHFLLIGATEASARMIPHAPRPNQFHTVAERVAEEMPAIYSMMNVASLRRVNADCQLAWIEALACGVPCVSPSMGDCQSLIGDCGILLRHWDSEHLSLAWEELLRLEPEEMLELSQRSRQRAQKIFSIGKYGEQMENLYENLLTRVPDSRASEKPGAALAFWSACRRLFKLI